LSNLSILPTFLKGNIMNNYINCPYCNAKYTVNASDGIEYKCGTKVCLNGGAYALNRSHNGDWYAGRDVDCYEREIKQIKTAKAIDAKKWRTYERDYVLPCFEWAKEAGLDLKQLVRDNPGHNCTELLVKTLLKMVDESEILKTKQQLSDLMAECKILGRTTESIRNFIIFMDGDLRELKEAEECDNG